MKLDHIGIAVKNMEASVNMYNNMLISTPFKTEFVESQGVNVSFYDTGSSKIELLSSDNPDSAISKFIEKKGEGIHHIAYLVSNILDERDRMQSKGFEPLSQKPSKGANNKLVMFFHPKTTGGVLVEICQEIV